MMTDEARGFVVGIVAGMMIVGVMLGLVVSSVQKSWREDSVAKGFAEYNPDDRTMAMETHSREPKMTHPSGEQGTTNSYPAYIKGSETGRPVVYVHAGGGEYFGQRLSQETASEGSFSIAEEAILTLFRECERLKEPTPTPPAAPGETSDLPPGLFSKPGMMGGNICIGRHRFKAAQMVAELAERSLEEFADDYRFDRDVVREAVRGVAMLVEQVSEQRKAQPTTPSIAADEDSEDLRASADSLNDPTPSISLDEFAKRHGLDSAEPQREVAGVEFPDGDCHWIRREGDWSIITGELSHSCRDAFAGWRGSEIVRGLLHELPKGGWTRAVSASETTALREQLAAWIGRYRNATAEFETAYRELEARANESDTALAAAQARIAELEAERDAMLD